METGKYKTQSELVDIADDLKVSIQRITNIDELYNNLVNQPKDSIEIKDERIPYWADLWPSAIALSKYLSTLTNFNNKQVLEIGCGLALPGIVASKIGAKVTFTDYIYEPLTFAKQNAELNNINNANYKIIDWRTINDTDLIGIDILLASDVAYEKRSFDDLLKAIQHVTSKGICFYLSEPNRQLAIPFISKLKDLALIKMEKTYDIHLNGTNNKVNVYELGAI